MFPTIFYKDGGKAEGKCQREGGTYDWVAVNNDEELEKAAKNGFYPTLEAALNPEGFDVDTYVAEIETVSDEAEQPDEESEAVPPQTREDLEAAAKELGIRFTKRTTDEMLSKKIAEKSGQ